MKILTFFVLKINNILSMYLSFFFISNYDQFWFYLISSNIKNYAAGQL